MNGDVVSKLRDLVELARRTESQEILDALLSLQPEIESLSAENRHLVEHVRALESWRSPRLSLNFRRPFYYAEGDDQPYCPRCWELRNRSSHLLGPFPAKLSYSHECLECSTKYYRETG